MGKQLGLKLGLTAARWERLATEAAVAAGVKPSLVLAGARDRVHAGVRWNVWGQLVAGGYSYYSIGHASGFHHTTVMYACLPNDVRAKIKHRRASYKLVAQMGAR